MLPEEITGWGILSLLATLLIGVRLMYVELQGIKKSQNDIVELLSKSSAKAATDDTNARTSAARADEKSDALSRDINRGS